MGVKKTLLIWMTSLSATFGTAANNPQFNCTTAMTTAATAQTPTEEKRVDFKPGVEEELRSTATKMVWKLGIHLQFGLAKQIIGMEDVLYYGLPVPIWNRIVTALNDSGQRAKIVSALINVVNGALSDDDKKVDQCKAAINGWQSDPLSFAKFLGDAVGMDFISTPKTSQSVNQPK
jgi:hypothetical protein